MTNGTQEIQSGAPLSDKPKPMVVPVHEGGPVPLRLRHPSGHEGAVRVVSKRRPVPSAAGDTRRVKLQASKAIAVAKTFKNVPAAENTMSLGLAGPGGVSLSPSRRTG